MGESKKAIFSGKGLFTAVKVVVLGGGGLLMLSCILCSGATALWYFAIRNTRPDYQPLQATLARFSKPRLGTR